MAAKVTDPPQDTEKPTFTAATGEEVKSVLVFSMTAIDDVIEQLKGES